MPEDDPERLAINVLMQAIADRPRDPALIQAVFSVLDDICGDFVELEKHFESESSKTLAD